MGASSAQTLEAYYGLNITHNFSPCYIPVPLQDAGTLAALAHPSHLVVDLKNNKHLGINEPHP
ncbi:hypothetical protein A8M58_16965 [Yersinia pestis]|nr:hypothetical protein A8M58_16965 [Yersinia pestis]